MNPSAPRQSLASLPGRRFAEPYFAIASTRFADAIADELIQAADVARPRWTLLANKYRSEMALMQDAASLQAGNLFHTPLVWDFVMAWRAAIRWRIVANHSDGIQFCLPDETVSPLLTCSSVSSIAFFLAALSDVCCARLGSNDHNNEYGLYLNVPVWIPLAVRPDCRDYFDRQLRMVVHHETGHFRWRGGSLRAEHIAHARGVSALRIGDWPSSSVQLQELLEGEHPEAWCNSEIRSLIQETRGGTRLVRAWGERRQRSQNTAL